MNQKLISTIIILLIFNSNLSAQSGIIDYSFNQTPDLHKLTPIGLVDQKVTCLTSQNDNKLLVAGRFQLPGTGRKYLIRFNSDKTVDSNFFVEFPLSNPIIKNVVVQNDGKILISGYGITSVNGTSTQNIVRLNSDGTIDQTFNISTGPTNEIGNLSEITDITLLPDGKIVVAGPFTNFNGILRKGIAVLNQDGSIFESFNAGFENLYLFSGQILDIESINNKIAICGSFSVMDGAWVSGQFVGNLYQGFLILNMDGTVPNTFITDNTTSGLNGCKAMSVVNDQYLICAKNSNEFVSIDIDGFENMNFTLNQPTLGLYINIIDIQTLPDNSIIYLKNSNSFESVVGRFNQFGDLIYSNYVVEEFSAITHLDTMLVFANEFPPNYVYSNDLNYEGMGFFSLQNGNIIQEKTGMGLRSVNAKVNALKILPNDNIYLGGTFSSYNNVPSNGLVRIKKNGFHDNSFNIGAGFTGSTNSYYELVNDFIILANGDVIVGGNFTNFNSANITNIAKIDKFGNLIEGFFQGIQFGSTGSVKKIKIHNSQIYILFTGNVIYTPTGEVFNHIIRVNLDGTLDQSFKLTNGNSTTGGFAGSVWSTNIVDFDFQSNSEILILGKFTYYNSLDGAGWKNLIRLHPNGLIDNTFWNGPKFKFNNSETDSYLNVNTINVLPDDKLIFTGRFSKYDTTNFNGIVKLTNNGQIDTIFNSGTGFGSIYNGFEINDVLIQPDGKMLIAGQTPSVYNGFNINQLVRINSNGSVDSSFSLNFNSNSIFNTRKIALQSDGSIIAGIDYSYYTGSTTSLYSPKVVHRFFNDSDFTLPLTSTISFNGTNCSDFGIILNAHNGTEPFNYSWVNSNFSSSNTFFIDSTGFYFYQIQDSTGYIHSNTIFSVFPTQEVDFSTSLITSQFRPGFTNEIFLNTSNISCTPSDAQLSLINNSGIQLSNFIPPPDNVNGDTIQWNLFNQNFSSEQFTISLLSHTPTSMQIGDSVNLELIVVSNLPDSDSSNNSKNYFFPIVNGYDPNDKKVYPTGECIPHYVGNENLTYTVRFQNTGNSNAINIEVHDQISDHLDISTFKPIANSHPMYIELLDSNIINFKFENIFLPDSSSNQLLSQGYVVFEIQPKPNLNFGDIITNKASIYFDFNEPIITNEVEQTFSNGEHASSYTTTTFTGCNSLDWNNQTITESGEYFFHTTNLFGCDSVATLHLILNYNIDTTIYSNGIDSVEFNGIYFNENGEYYFTLLDQNGCDSNITLIVNLEYTNITNIFDGQLFIYPNPNTGSFNIEIDNQLTANCIIKDTKGTIVRVITLDQSQNYVDINSLASGTYFLHFNSSDYSIIKKIQKL